MRPRSRSVNDAGFSLLELAVAIVVLTLALGVTAQALITYFDALEIQERRNQAVHHCKSVIAVAREVREGNPDNFPGAITSRFPHGETVPEFATLPGEVITVTYVDPTSNPLEMVVTSQWEDRKGRPVTLRVGTILTDR